MLDRIKNFIRCQEARYTPRTTEVVFRGMTLRFYRSAWWVAESQPIFDEEILPYFAGIERPAGEVKCVIDAGAATGTFAVAAARAYPSACFHLFEPSPRQRTLLERNLRLNGIGADRAAVYEKALWDQVGSQTFRTIGSMSSIESVSSLSDRLAFAEQVATISLDEWCKIVSPNRIDLVKMDIEGAEIEAMRGAEATLARFKPELLIMAYHERENARTFERCADQLKGWGYRVKELPVASGFLHAVAG